MIGGGLDMLATFFLLWGPDMPTTVVTRDGQIVVRPDKGFFVRSKSGQFFFVRTLSGLSGRTNNCPASSKLDCSPFFGIWPFEIKAEMDRDNFQFALATWRVS